MTASLDKREQALNKAVDFMRQVDGVESFLSQCKFEKIGIEKKESLEAQDKVRLLVVQGSIKRAEELRNSLVRQCYDELKYHFGEHPANPIVEGNDAETRAEPTTA